MSTVLHPTLIEARTSPQVAALLRERFAAHGLGHLEDDPLCEALLQVAARYGEILAEQLNAAPEHHRREFFARLHRPPELAAPARVLLAFEPVARASDAPAIVVPAFTPAVAAPAGADREPVVFETLSDLDVLRATARVAFAVDGQRGTWADATPLLAAPGRPDTGLFDLAQPLSPLLCLALPAGLEALPLERLTIEQATESGAVPAAGWPALQWGLLAKDGFVPLEVAVPLSADGSTTLAAPSAWPPLDVGGLQARWLAARPSSDVAPAPVAVRLRVGARCEVRDQPLAAAFGASLPVDLSKDFFPFGEWPRFGELFQAQSPAFGQAGAEVTLAIRMTNPAGLANAPLPPVDPAGQPRVAWETFTAGGWTRLDADDGTLGFLQDGDVSFRVPADAVPATIAGQGGPWIRARLAAGHYGTSAAVNGMARPLAPSLATVRVQSRLDVAPAPPAAVVRRSAIEERRLDPALTPWFEPFPAADDTGPWLYLGLEIRESLAPGRVLSLQLASTDAGDRQVSRGADAAAAGPPTWQSLTATGWHDCPLLDDPQAHALPGLARLRLDGAPQAWPGNAFDPAGRLGWLRLALGPLATTRHPRRLALNAVAARQTLRLDNELLGSSTGRANQVFHALRTPVVDDVVLQVREPVSAAGATRRGDDGSDWVGWDIVPDFGRSTPQDRHALLDRRTGAITFGDGLRGRLPPPGANNVRLHVYHAGGGTRGNRPAGAIDKLRTTVPYVASVVNVAEAAGGRDAGEPRAVGLDVARWLRHRDRAVCADDYVDIALAVAPEVARAHCRAASEPGAPGAAYVRTPGSVSLIVLPHGDAPRPQPDAGLLARVRQALDDCKPLGATLVVAGPDYVALSVTAGVVAAAGCSPHAVGQACRRALERFLHPVTGGDAGTGWAPGRRPHRSDLAALLAGVDGVARVDDLRLRGELAGDAIACAGEIEVEAVARNARDEGAAT